MQVTAVVRWVYGKQCSALVDALKQGMGALVCEVDIHKLGADTIMYMGTHVVKFPLSFDHSCTYPGLLCGLTTLYS
jgi:hypothetical protein